MNRSSFTLSIAAAIALSLGALTAHATDTNTAAQGLTDSSGSHGTDATDRGGRPSNNGDQDNATATSILDWLTGLMD